MGGKVWSAIWPENTGVFVVSVDAPESGITSGMTINEALNPTNAAKLAATAVDAELDVFYYLEDEGGYDYTFTPLGVTSVTLAQPVVGTNITSYTGFSADGVTGNGDGSYTLRLVHGRNIVKLTSATGSVYQVLTAKPVTYTVTNASREGENIQQGDKVSVRFNTLYHPCNKLAGVYNMSASIQYTANGSAVNGGSNQYAFASNANAQTVSATIPAGWDVTNDFTFTGGVLKASGYGDPYGGHRDITLETGKNPNFTAVTRLAYFGALPDIAIKVYDEGTGLDKISGGNRISVYPNPFANYIVIEAVTGDIATVYDLSGKIVLSAGLTAGSNRIDASALPKGVYVLKLGGNTLKIVK
jgi:hypothetical protein